MEKLRNERFLLFDEKTIKSFQSFETIFFLYAEKESTLNIRIF